MITALLLSLLVQDAPAVYRNPALGVTLTPAKGWVLRTKDFKFAPANAMCEVESPDGEVKGMLAITVLAGNAHEYAAFRAGGLAAGKGVKKIEQAGEETLQRPEGDWLRREYVVTYAKASARYLGLFVSRRSRNVELLLWCADAKWADAKAGAIATTDGLAIERPWSCGACGEAVKADDKACAKCSAALSAPHAEFDAWTRKRAIQVVTTPAALYPRKTMAGESVAGKPASAEALQEFCGILLREASRYPDEFWTKLAVERIVLCQGLLVNNAPRGAVCDFEGETIHIDVLNAKDDPEVRFEAIHHELFHFVDVRDDGTMKKDAAWEKLNPPRFRYGPQRAPAIGLQDGNPGFLNTYSMTAVGEDKAEIFGNLVARGKAVEERAAKDAVLAAKVARMKEIVKSWCPAVDDGFWVKK